MLMALVVLDVLDPIDKQGGSCSGCSDRFLTGAASLLAAVSVSAYERVHAR